MIVFKNTRDNELLILFSNTNTFDEKHGVEFVKKMKLNFKEHEIITVDLQGIVNIDTKGYKFLSEINKWANDQGCNIHYTNVHDNLNEIIDSFTLTSES